MIIVPSYFHYLLAPEKFDGRWKPQMLALVIVKSGNELMFKLMNFSLIPSWSRERRPKFATHNARLDGVAT